jgi:hypothetical protein
MRDRRSPQRETLAAVLLLALLCSACVSTPYEYSHDVDGELTLKLRDGEAQIERGVPNAFLDGIGHYVISLPSKILLLRWNVNDHDISPETEAALRVYLHENGLYNVKVRLNQYAPGGEWRRLANNKDVGAFWRWTFGLISTSLYTILPGRFFAGLLGGDNYNPFTNTVNLYSDSIPIALHEGGHAKDFALKSNRHWRGGYAALRILPLVPLWQEAVATNDALSFLYAKDDTVERKSAYRTLYPAYGTYVGGFGGQYGQYLPLGPSWVGFVIAYGPVVVGHVVGQSIAPFVHDRDDLSEPVDWPPPLEPPPPPEADPSAPEPDPSAVQPSGEEPGLESAVDDASATTSEPVPSAAPGDADPQLEPSAEHSPAPEAPPDRTPETTAPR